MKTRRTMIVAVIAAVCGSGCAAPDAGTANAYLLQVIGPVLQGLLDVVVALF